MESSYISTAQETHTDEEARQIAGRVGDSRVSSWRQSCSPAGIPEGVEGFVGILTPAKKVENMLFRLLKTEGDT